MNPNTIGTLDHPDEWLYHLYLNSEGPGDSGYADSYIEWLEAQATLTQKLSTERDEEFATLQSENQDLSDALEPCRHALRSIVDLMYRGPDGLDPNKEWASADTLIEIAETLENIGIISIGTKAVKLDYDIFGK